MHYRLEHEFDCDPKTYWEIFFSDEYNTELYSALKMKNRETLELKDDGKVLHRVQRMTPTSDIPGIFRSVIKDPSYVERNTFHRERSSMDVIIEPAMMKNKFDMRAVYSVVPVGDKKCKRIFDGDVKVSIMLLGGQIEKYMIEQLRTSYEVATRVTRDWVAKRKSS